MLGSIARPLRATLLVGVVLAVSCAPAASPAGTAATASPSTPSAVATAAPTSAASAVPASASAAPVAAATILATALPVAPTPAPATAAPAAPPPAPPVVVAPTVKAVPTTGTRGTTFVFQLANFPPNVEFALTVARPDGKTSQPTVWRIADNGTGLATFATSLGDPAGPYVAVFKNGGVSAQVVFQLQ